MADVAPIEGDANVGREGSALEQEQAQAWVVRSEARESRAYCGSLEFSPRRANEPPQIAIEFDRCQCRRQAKEKAYQIGCGWGQNRVRLADGQADLGCGAETPYPRRSCKTCGSRAFVVPSPSLPQIVRSPCQLPK